MYEPMNDGSCYGCKCLAKLIADLKAKKPKWQKIADTFDDIPKDTPVLVRDEWDDWLTTSMLIWEMGDGEFEGGWVWAQLSHPYHPNLLAAEDYEFDDDYDYEYWHPLPSMELDDG